MKHELKAVKALFAKLKRAQLQTFPEHRQKLDTPVRRGVYVIYSPRGQKAFHVGSTPTARGGIKQRLRGYMGHKTGKRAYSSFVKYYPPLGGAGSKLRGKYRFGYLEVDCARQRTLLEAYAIGHLCPAHLGVGDDNTANNRYLMNGARTWNWLSGRRYAIPSVNCIYQDLFLGARSPESRRAGQGIVCNLKRKPPNPACFRVDQRSGTLLRRS